MKPIIENVDNTKQSPFTTISIGPGIRGIERGIESTGARLDVLAYVEIESFIIENLVAEMESGLLDSSVIWSDCKTFPSHIFRGKVNLLLAGYPCQPFSAAGKRAGAEDPRHLYPHIARAIDIIRPDCCFFENVRGHVTLGLREVIESLEGMGYRVRWGIFSAEETGASHKRERVFIMAIRKDILENTLNSGMRGRNDEGIDRESEVQIERSGCLANDNSQRESQQKRIDEKELGRFGNQCKNMDISSSNGQQSGDSISARRNSTELAGEIGVGLADSEGIHVQRLGSRQREEQFGRSGINGELAYTDNSGSQQDSKPSELRTERIEQSSSDSRRNNEREEIERSKRSVARPGQVQHGWERPRTISYAEEALEPPLGCTANGHRFREDFLRALGNSVYPETAALAWRTLIRKFQ